METTIITDEPKTEKSSVMKGVLLKALFVIGILFVLFIVGFALMLIIPRIISGLGGAATSLTTLFRGKDGIAVTASDSAVGSGEHFFITWDDENEKSGTGYSISYECASGLTVFIDGERVDCEVSHDVSLRDKEVEVAGTLAKDDSFVDALFTVSAIEDGKTVRDGEIVVTISTAENPGNSVSTSTPSGTGSTVTRTDSPSTSSGSNSNSNSGGASTGGGYYVAPVYATGPADLAISSIERGIISGGVFVPKSSVGSGETPAIRFNVVNVGGRATGTWSFMYSVPVQGGSVQASGSQPSIGAGQSAQYVVTFNGHSSGDRKIEVTLDPSNYVAEGSESNNTASVTLDLRSSTGNYGDNDDVDYDEDDDADLVVRILETGRISGGRFVEDNNVDSDDNVAVKFRIENRGGEDAEDWRYEVRMTGDDTMSYESGRQNDLRPGQAVEFIIGFDDIDEDADEVTFTIEADSQDDVDEESEGNNDDSEDVELDN